MRPRCSFLIVGAFAAGAFALTWWWRGSSGSSHPIEAAKASASGTSIVPHIERPRIELQSASSLPGLADTATLSTLHHAKTQLVDTPPHTVGRTLSEGQGPESTTRNASQREAIDSSVIDIPFPVSESVEALCRESSSPNRDYCATTNKLLKRLAKEPRDMGWAGRVEGELKRFIETKEPGKYSIRAIECRSSLCAVEVASGVGAYWGGFRQGDALYDELFRGIASHGYEERADGSRITVTVVPYSRDIDD